MNLCIRLLVLFGIAFSFVACGESPADKAARETYEQQQAANKAKKDQAEAAAARYQKYHADCKTKNGDRYWGPFTWTADYRLPRTWYDNGRFKTVKRNVANKSDAVWREAMKQKACVIAASGPYGVAISLANGASFTLTQKIRQKGVPRSEWKTKTTLVKEIYFNLW